MFILLLNKQRRLVLISRSHSAIKTIQKPSQKRLNKSQILFCLFLSSSFLIPFRYKFVFIFSSLYVHTAQGLPCIQTIILCRTVPHSLVLAKMVYFFHIVLWFSLHVFFLLFNVLYVVDVDVDIQNVPNIYIDRYRQSVHLFAFFFVGVKS